MENNLKSIYCSEKYQCCALPRFSGAIRPVQTGWVGEQRIYYQYDPTLGPKIDPNQVDQNEAKVVDVQAK